MGRTVRQTKKDSNRSAKGTKTTGGDEENEDIEEVEEIQTVQTSKNLIDDDGSDGELEQPTVTNWASDSFANSRGNTDGSKLDSAARELIKVDAAEAEELGKRAANDLSINDLMRILIRRGYDNSNPALAKGAEKLLLQLNCVPMSFHRGENVNPFRGRGRDASTGQHNYHNNNYEDNDRTRSGGRGRGFYRDRRGGRFGDDDSSIQSTRWNNGGNNRFNNNGFGNNRYGGRDRDNENNGGSRFGRFSNPRNDDQDSDVIGGPDVNESNNQSTVAPQFEKQKSEPVKVFGRRGVPPSNRFSYNDRDDRDDRRDRRSGYKQRENREHVNSSEKEDV